MESQVSVDDGSSWAGRIFASKLVDYLAILGASGSLLAGFSSLWKDRAEYKALAEDCSEKADSAKMAETLIRGRLAGCFRGEPFVNFDPKVDSALWSSTFAGYPRAIPTACLRTTPWRLRGVALQKLWRIPLRALDRFSVN